MPDITYFMVFIMGLAGGVHCVGMCGGLCSAFVLQLPANISRFRLILLLNLGRLSSYSMIGLLLGALGQWGLSFHDHLSLAKILFIISQILLLFMGLYLAGLSHLLNRLENIGRPIWKKLSPILNRLLPIQNTWSCFAVGALWGWLPCGLIYTMSTYALSRANAWEGALLMLCFGIGTLPNLLLIGFSAATFSAFIRHRHVRKFAGLLVCFWAIWQLLTLI